MAKGKPTRVDVELKEVAARFEVWRILARGAVAVACIAVTALPLYFLRGIVTPLAGKTTKVDVNVALAATATLSIMVNGIQAAKGQHRKREMQRERKRADDLEERLGVPPRPGM